MAHVEHLLQPLRTQVHSIAARMGIARADEITVQLTKGLGGSARLANRWSASSDVVLNLPLSIVAASWRDLKTLYNFDGVLRIDNVPVDFKRHNDVLLFSPRQRAFVVAHELGHVAHGDILPGNQLRYLTEVFAGRFSDDAQRAYCERRICNELRADAAAAALGDEYIRGGIEHLEKKRLFGKVCHLNVVAAGKPPKTGADGEDLDPDRIHPLLSERLTILRALLPDGGVGIGVGGVNSGGSRSDSKQSKRRKRH
jgi:hypothetical protein